MIKKILILSFILIFLVGCGKTIENTTSGDTNIVVEKKSSPAMYQVIIENGRFNPVDLDIKVGDTVEWINKDYMNGTIGVKHTVTFEDARIDTVLPAKGTISHTFKQKGEARYFCQFHAGMKGTIKVS